MAHLRLAGERHPRVMRLAVPGRHMALNALGALLAAIEVDAAIDEVLDGLAGFEGVRRRFELVGAVGSVRVFDDYAHHPTEIGATLAAVRSVLQHGAPVGCWSFSSRICTRAPRLSPPSSVAPSAPPTRCLCSTSTAPANSPWPASAGPASPGT
ncbi:mur ligase family, glutamate ligase domain protein [Mycobacterium kansasii]|uniref:Mur ligase family, glutamate ligase domain protein n=1 Tax=Mycobacterium kansasii TaxID=1768 RepID=A0A1V3WMD2_MYCKA|nr:mur ligase family, glutamate ligase domain protein [Mycobacterium kansasii]